MFNLSSISLLTLLLSTSLLAGCSQAQTTIPKPAKIKLIHAGWERPNSSHFRQYIRQIEKTPYDGIVLMLSGRDDNGKNVNMQTAFNQTPWKRQWFQKNIDDLKAIKSPLVAESFIRMGVTPEKIDWFDDAAWKTVVEHFRIAAWVAKESGLKGICFDPEMYQHQVFTYGEQDHAAKYTFAEYDSKVRQRGQELLQAIKSEYPDMVFFTFFMNSYNLWVGSNNELERRRYGLLPAFINGWLDEAPPEMVFVDGSENTYRSDGELDYLRLANDLGNRVPGVVAPENHRKYQTQVQVAIAFYLDSYINPPTSSWYHGPLNGSRVARLQSNLNYAAEATDQYIWTWGEKYRWWPTTTPKVNPESWDQILPGAADALLSVSKPEVLTERANAKLVELAKTGTPKNLIVNGNFNDNRPNTTATQRSDWQVKGAPAGWNTWQKDKGKSAGQFSLDFQADRQGNPQSGAAKMSGMQRGGTFIQSIKVNPGEYYMIRGWYKPVGNGKGYIAARWQDANGKWVQEKKDTRIAAEQAIIPDQWQQLSQVILVPPDANRLVLLLGAIYQSDPADIAWFDDIETYHIPN